MRYLRHLLRWLRVTDESHVLSLTHAFLVVACLVYWRHPDAITAATAAAAVANYSAKNIIRRRADASDKAADRAAPLSGPSADTVTALHSRVATLETALGAIRNTTAWKEALKR